jgi:hypothetical protein
MNAYWEIAPYSFVEDERRFRGSYYLHQKGAMMMESASTSETSVSFYETIRRNGP